MRVLAYRLLVQAPSTALIEVCFVMGRAVVTPEAHAASAAACQQTHNTAELSGFSQHSISSCRLGLVRVNPVYLSSSTHSMPLIFALVLFSHKPMFGSLELANNSSSKYEEWCVPFSAAISAFVSVERKVLVSGPHLLSESAQGYLLLS